MMNDRKSCGDVNLDYMLERGIIAELTTCCNNAVYGDHNCSIIMKEENMEIHSYTSMVSNSIHIKLGDMIYIKEVESTKSIHALLSMFMPMEKEPKKTVVFYKAPVGADLENNKTISTKEEFNAIFKKFPLAVQNCITKRHSEKEVQKNVQIFTNVFNNK